MPPRDASVCRSLRRFRNGNSIFFTIRFDFRAKAPRHSVGKRRLLCQQRICRSLPVRGSEVLIAFVPAQPRPAITLTRPRGSGLIQTLRARANNEGAPAARIVSQGIAQCVVLSASYFPYDFVSSNRCFCWLMKKLNSTGPGSGGSPLVRPRTSKFLTVRCLCPRTWPRESGQYVPGSVLPLGRSHP